jgi:hypothetical protein
MAAKESFAIELARALARGQLKARVGRFQGMPLFVALLAPLFDLLLRIPGALFVHPNWSPRDLAWPPPCCDGRPRTATSADGFAFSLRPSRAADWFSRVGVAPRRLGGDGDEGLDVQARRLRQQPTSPTSLAGSSEAQDTAAAAVTEAYDDEKAKRIVRENICTDFIRLYIYAMVVRKIWKLDKDEAMESMVDALGSGARRTGFEYELALELIGELPAINSALVAHYQDIHGSTPVALPLDGTLRVCLEPDAPSSSTSKRKRCGQRDRRTALLAIHNRVP